MSAGSGEKGNCEREWRSIGAGEGHCEFMIKIHEQPHSHGEGGKE